MRQIQMRLSHNPHVASAAGSIAQAALILASVTNRSDEANRANNASQLESARRSREGVLLREYYQGISGPDTLTGF